MLLIQCMYIEGSIISKVLLLIYGVNIMFVAIYNTLGIIIIIILIVKSYCSISQVSSTTWSTRHRSVPSQARMEDSVCRDK